MKKYLLCLMLCGLTLQTACSSGGSDEEKSEENSQSIEECTDGVCSSLTTFEEGNFVLQIFDSEDASGQPAYSTINNDEIMLFCEGDESSVNSNISIACSESDSDIIITTSCYRGYLYYDISVYYEEDDTYYVDSSFATDCQTQAVYCDEIGFELSPACEEDAE